jgi:hypothetical protein
MSNDLILSRRMIEKTRKIDGQIVSTDLNFNVSAKNVSGKELKGIELIEKVPKEITENTKSINFADKPKVLKEDPLFEWLFDLNINEIKDFKYHINGVSDKSILKDMNSFFKNLAIPTALLQLEAGKEDACKGKNCNDKNPCTVDYCAAGKCIHSANDGISCDNNKVCYQGQCIEKKLIIEKICQYNQIAWLGKDCEIIMQTITTTALVIAIIAGIVFIARKRKQKKHLHKLQKAEKVQETKVEKKEEREHKQEAKKEEKPAIEEKPEKKEKKIEQLPEQEQPKPAKEKKKRKKTKKERRKEKRQRKKKKKANKKPKK